MHFSSLGEQMQYDNLTDAEKLALEHQYQAEKEQEAYELQRLDAWSLLCISRPEHDISSPEYDSDSRP